MRTLGVLRDALGWIEDNPSAWWAIEDAAAADYAEGRRISVAHYVENVRAKDYPTISGDRFAINNSYIPVFARVLILDNPEYRGHVELRKSRFDEVLGRG